jgi:uncharacterized membrane protein YfcA
MSNPTSGAARIDWAAIRSGAAVCLVFAIPFSLAARWAADSRDDSALAVLLTLCAIAGFVIGSGVAAWVQQTGFPLVHGLVTASSTYVIAQAVFITLRLFMGRDVHWFSAVFNLTPVLFAGMLGGFLGQLLQRNGWQPSSVRRSGGNGP